MKNVDRLKEIIKGEIITNEPMSKHTSFRIGGPAEIFVKPLNKEELREVLNWAKTNKLPVFVIGNGTNIIVSDDGVEGVVIKLSEAFDEVKFSGNNALAGAGAGLQGFLEEAMKRNLGGLEFAWGIPGAIGGSIVMNAGSNSHFISTKVEYVDVMDYEGKEYKLLHDNLKFDYRYSILQIEPLILIDSLFTLDIKDSNYISMEKEMNLKARWEKQPVNYPCAGSVFKNPPTTYAGKVLEESGCKGLRVGDAMISEKHANFIVNLGSATARDVLSLIKEAQARVYKHKDLILELEIKLVGKFKEINLIERKK
jgi:UDP-N-acetylmuramate dehydrogenase